ncbi:MAG TPA: phosphoribosylaminoimidazolesuccinocarboxamide synthase [Acidimicrobiales bacterium]|nr:phosphoribosylaminoimidazolesuccinocarboxamide synthase [Acidimicrobiales bacterium]
MTRTLEGLEHLHTGKVRDLYAVGERGLLLVASDRLSAFDVVMDEPIPEKGRALTAMTAYWCEHLADVVACALVTCDPAAIEASVPGFGADPSLAGRTMLSRRAEMVPLECIVRGRLAGQAYDEYRKSGTIHTMPAPGGLELTDAFDEPIFTPSTKAAVGHDVNVSFDEACALVGTSLATRIRAICLEIYRVASQRVSAAGLVLADTKFELGLVDGELVLCDEVVTPDSSRLWPIDGIVRGEVPPAFDKQPFRDWLAAKPWDRTPPPPHVPDDVVAETSRRYVAAYERVTGRSLDDWYGHAP